MQQQDVKDMNLLMQQQDVKDMNLLKDPATVSAAIYQTRSLRKYINDLPDTAQIFDDPDFDHRLSTLLLPVVERLDNRPPEEYTIKPFNWSDEHQQMAFSGLATARKADVKVEAAPHP
uniref:Uncharacterized protein n=1 Tax=Eutreptiella gymnastica TaxID=73025 RepID=A0A7S4GDB1_9EUGL